MKPKLVATILFLAAPFGFAEELLFSQMEDGDRVEVTRKSTGCFHDTTSYYEIRKRDGACFFKELAITWSQGSPPEVVEKKTVGEIVLGEKDILGLDALLKFYRGEKKASSTTQVSLVVEYFEPRGRVKVEKLRDGSGGYGLGGRNDVVTFFDLAQRFQDAVKP